MNEDNTYGCDICGESFDWDDGIVWLTSSFGVCDECYSRLSQEEKERIYEEYE